MSFGFYLAEQSALANDARRLFEAGIEQDVVLGFLRKGGLGLLNSIKVLSDLTGTPLVAAQKTLQASRAWQHTFAQDTTLHAQIAEAVKALQVIDAEDSRPKLARP